MKRKLHLNNLILYTILQILSVLRFEKKSVLSALAPLTYTKPDVMADNQLIFKFQLDSHTQRLIGVGCHRRINLIPCQFCQREFD